MKRALIQCALVMLIMSASCAQRSRASRGPETPPIESTQSPATSPQEGDLVSDQPPESAPPSSEEVASEPSNPPPPVPPAGEDKAATDASPVLLHPFPHIEIDLTAGEVRFDGIACLDVGWLEQVVCAPSSREHESLIVSLARPSHIHAALLAAGFTHGEPGRWTYEKDEVAVIPPTGDEIDVEVKYENRAGEVVRESIRLWIRDHRGEHEFPSTPWVFGGSRMRQAPASHGGGEVYEADFTGSIIGLVTFGDEVIGWREVLADQEAVQPPEWEVNTPRVPTPGTSVQIILRRVSGGPKGG